METIFTILKIVGALGFFMYGMKVMSEGIQKGHMGLHSRNVAIRAGVPDFLVGDVSNFMKNNNSINELTANKYLEVINIFLNFYFYIFSP